MFKMMKKVLDDVGNLVLKEKRPTATIDSLKETINKNMASIRTKKSNSKAMGRAGTDMLRGYLPTDSNYPSYMGNATTLGMSFASPIQPLSSEAVMQMAPVLSLMAEMATGSEHFKISNEAYAAIESKMSTKDVKFFNHRVEAINFDLLNYGQSNGNLTDVASLQKEGETFADMSKRLTVLNSMIDNYLGVCKTTIGASEAGSYIYSSEREVYLFTVEQSTEIENRVDEVARIVGYFGGSDSGNINIGLELMKNWANGR